MKFQLKFIRDFSYFEIAEQICLKMGQKIAKHISITWGRGWVGSNFFPDEDNEGTIIYVIWFF